MVKFSDRGCGIKYIHPNDNGTYIRVMPGKPHSPIQPKENLMFQKKEQEKH